MKKKCCVFLSMVLLIIMVTGSVTVLSNDNVPTISISNVTGIQGEVVTLLATVTNNPGFNSASFLIDYNKTALSLESVELGEKYSSFVPSYTGLPYITFYGAKDILDDGTLLIMKFKIVASSGVYGVTLSYNEGDVANINENDVNFKIISGAVTVSNNNVPTISISNVTGTQGEVVTVLATVTNNPGFNSASFLIDYNKTSLSLESVELGEKYSSFVPSYTGLPYITFYGAKDIFDDGILLIMKFKIIASFGVYGVTLSYDEGDVADINENDVNFKITSGAVTILNSNDYSLLGWYWNSNYSSATATFINSADESDTVTVTDDTIERQLTEPSVDGGAYVFTYTASVEGPDGQTYTDQKVKNALFAGWYKDAEFNECYTEAPEDAGKAFAKWVDPMILGIRFQLKTNTSVKDENTVLRVLTSVDTLNYENVGFVVRYIDDDNQEVEKVFKTDTVYKKVSGTTELGSIDYEPTVFSPVSTRFCAFNLTIPQKLFDKAISYTAFWTTYDGTVVYGESGSMTLSGHMSQD